MKKNNYKKILTFFLVLVIAIGITSHTALAAVNVMTARKTFDDVLPGQWYSGYVGNLVDQGIVSGFSESNEFRPSEQLTRQQAAKMIAESAGLKHEGKISTFKDVRKDSWATGYIRALQDVGAATGYGDTNEFRPLETIKRSHIAKLVVIAFGLEKGDLELKLKDIEHFKKSDPAIYNAIIILASNGIVKGYGDMSFRPDNQITRAEFSKIIAISQASAAVQTAEKDGSPESQERAKKLVDNLPDDQDQEMKASLEKRIAALEAEAPEVPDLGPGPGPGPGTDPGPGPTEPTIPSGVPAGSVLWTEIDWGGDIVSYKNGDTLYLALDGGTDGEMNDFRYIYSPPYNSDKLSGAGIKKVKILEGITSIGDYAFSSQDEPTLASKVLTSVAIPDSVISIGRYAFSNNFLSSVTIPEAVKTIGTGAFARNNLSSIVIPYGVERIEDSAFYNNYLSTIKIPDSVTYLSGFGGNRLTGSIEIPNSVLTIGYNAFAGNNLSSVTIPNSVTAIEGSAFQGNKLDSITIPESVESIGWDAFAYNNLKTITIKDGVKSIGESAFYNNNLDTLEIPGSVVTIGAGAFASCSLTSVKIDYGVQAIGSAAFASNSIASLTLPDSITTIDSSAFSDNLIDSIILPESTTIIGALAFQGNILNSVVIPEHVEIINERAFSRNKLTEVEFAGNVSILADDSFNYNGEHGDISAPISASDTPGIFILNEKLKLWESLPSALLSKITEAEAFTEGDYTVASWDNLQLALNDARAIYDDSDATQAEINSALTTLIAAIDALFPSGVPAGSILWDAIDWGGDIVSYIDEDTLYLTLKGGSNGEMNNFGYYSPNISHSEKLLGVGINKLVILEGITSIGDYAFASPTGSGYTPKILSSVVIPDSVTSIGRYAFYNNTLNSITIPIGVTEISDSAFQDNILVSVTIPESVISIGCYAFYNNTLSSVTIPIGVTEIGDSAFQNNILVSVTIPESVISIGRYAFSSNMLELIVIPGSVETIEVGAFLYNLPMTSVVIKDGVKTIGREAFAQNSINYVELPESITTIGASAFEYNQLKSVVIPENVNTIYKEAFSRNKLTKVQFEKNVMNLAADSFYYNGVYGNISASINASLTPGIFTLNEEKGEWERE